jgi:hypothetical protein
VRRSAPVERVHTGRASLAMPGLQCMALRAAARGHRALANCSKTCQRIPAHMALLHVPAGQSLVPCSTRDVWPRTRTRTPRAQVRFRQVTRLRLDTDAAANTRGGEAWAQEALAPAAEPAAARETQPRSSMPQMLRLAMGLPRLELLARRQRPTARRTSRFGLAWHSPSTTSWGAASLACPTRLSKA